MHILLITHCSFSKITKMACKQLCNIYKTLKVIFLIKK